MRPICRRPGTAGSCRSAWWGWKDSNLQPERYERTSPAPQTSEFFRPTKMTLPLIFDWTSSPRRACMQNRQDCRDLGVHAREPGLPGPEVVEAPILAKAPEVHHEGSPKANAIVCTRYGNGCSRQSD